MTLLLKEGFSLAEINDVRLGTTRISKIYSGTDLVYEMNPIDTTAPITTVYPDATKTYAAGTKVWLEVNEACITYYTLDGTEPTTASAIFAEPFVFDTTTTIKYFSVDLAGNTEAVKTTVFNIEAAPAEPAFPRYIRFIGYGDQTSTTTRLVEIQAMHGADNLLLNKLPISGETPNAGAGIAAATDGLINMGSGTYPLWWMGAGIPTLTYDLGDWYGISEIRLWQYSISTDPRQTRFILQTSADNITYATIADYSTNTTVQPDNGWIIPL